MARLARVILPNFPHHILQRGNRGQDVFFKEEDYEYYLELLKQWCRHERIKILGYCLMSNHIHLVLKPCKRSNVSKAVGEVHRRYTQMINLRENWRGYLWQGRFSSFPMDKPYLLKTLAYVDLNPVKANIVKSPYDYPYSSAKAHKEGQDPRDIIKPSQLQVICCDWEAYLKQAQKQSISELQAHNRTGRPLGSDRFIKRAEKLLNRDDLMKKKPGPKVNKD